MTAWSELRESVGLPRGHARAATALTVLTLLAAGFLLQERVTRPDPSSLDYSELCGFVERGSVRLVVVRGQAISGDFSSEQAVGHERALTFRSMMPLSDPAFFERLRAKSVRVRILPAGPGWLARLLVAALPLLCFLGFGWFVRWPARQAP